ncbi:hypothetical protein F5148DRAFT_1146536 [Russula earlei]|uniref:Uncharacterized protein n=1 Tax=Russula earlei TaxID=71964 RepID=A0ACC0UJA1_9AGAM|nr:hypothetical protein F5148DRAFT_1146536 [Russula earlei]
MGEVAMMGAGVTVCDAGMIMVGATEMGGEAESTVAGNTETFGVVAEHKMGAAEAMETASRTETGTDAEMTKVGGAGMLTDKAEVMGVAGCKKKAVGVMASKTVGKAEAMDVAECEMGAAWATEAVGDKGTAAAAGETVVEVVVCNAKMLKAEVEVMEVVGQQDSSRRGDRGSWKNWGHMLRSA